MIELICNPEGLARASRMAFVETTRSIEALARSGYAPPEDEIIDLFMRSLMFNAFGLVRDEESESGWRETKDSSVLAES